MVYVIRKQRHSGSGWEVLITAASFDELPDELKADIAMLAATDADNVKFKSLPGVGRSIGSHDGSTIHIYLDRHRAPKERT